MIEIDVEIKQTVTITIPNIESNFPVGSDEWLENVHERCESDIDSFTEKVCDAIEINPIDITEIRECHIG